MSDNKVTVVIAMSGKESVEITREDMTLAEVLGVLSQTFDPNGTYIVSPGGVHANGDTVLEAGQTVFASEKFDNGLNG